MNIIQSWKESLALVWPSNLKPFSLVTAKTVIDVYRLLDKPFRSRGNWILAGLLVLLIGLTNILRTFGMVFIEGVILNSIFHALFFIFIAVIRPSIAMKDRLYYFSLLHERWYLLLITIVLGILPIYYIPFLFIYYVLFLIFALDSENSAKGILVSLKNSGKMLLYNFPLFLLVYLLMAIVNFLCNFLVAFALGYFGGLTFATIIYIIFIPVEVAVLMNIYIKLLHSQPSVYFNQPE